MQSQGTTPLTLKLKRKKPGVIRIEKEGYNPHEIRITRKKPSQFDILPFVFGNCAIVTPITAALTPWIVPKFISRVC